MSFPHGCGTGVSPFYRWENRGLERFSKSEPGLWLPGCSSTWLGGGAGEESAERWVRGAGRGGSGRRLHPRPLPHCVLRRDRSSPRVACPVWAGVPEQQLLPRAGSPHPASPEGVNPVPLSFRTNTMMLLMKSSRPSGECGTCRGGRAPVQATPAVLSGLTACPLTPFALCGSSW